MDTIRDTFTAGRRDMLDAFVKLSDLARRAGVDEDKISAVHGQFFDGNVAIKVAHGGAVLLAEIRASVRHGHVVDELDDRPHEHAE